ncbi:phage minor tail protein L [Achromobacter sp. RTa]|uniref:phage minor tail protein L n=1 Tax=Achromobacter sp. RTa TaxID=1532557 RepID=UPI0021009840|nr:phage minor tail protein L [Achromobacter sp. RTa]
MAKRIYAEIQKLDMDGPVDLYTLDLTQFGGEFLRFHGYLKIGPIYWQGEEYNPWPIVLDGLETVGEGPPPSPTLSVGNIGEDHEGNPLPGLISGLCIQYQDLVGAKVAMIRTLAQFLDAENFPEGNPSADPTEYLPPEVWEIEWKQSETPQMVVFELSSVMDAEDIQVPDLVVQTSVCAWTRKGGYRGPYCAYAGAAMFDEDDNPTTDPARDKCPGLFSSCKARRQGFPDAVMNFLAFPAADRVRS